MANVYTATWNATSGSWFTAGNWSDQNPTPPPDTISGVPGADNSVNIDNASSAFTVSYDGTDTIYSLTTQSEVTLSIDGGSLTILDEGTDGVGGVLNLAKGATLINDTGVLYIASGTFAGTLAGAGDIDFVGGTVSFNSGVNLQRLATWELGVTPNGFGVNAILNTNLTYSGHFEIDDYNGNNATLDLNGHDLTLTGLADLQGTFSGPGTVEITKSAVELSNYTATTIVGGAVLEEAAGATIVQQGNVTLGDQSDNTSGTLLIKAGATYNVVSNTEIQGNNTSEAILDNAGSFVISGGITATIDATFDNTGTISIGSGAELSDFYGSYIIGGTVTGPGTLFLGPSTAVIDTTKITVGTLYLGGNLDYGTDTTLDVNLTYGGNFFFDNEFAALNLNKHTLTLGGDAILTGGGQVNGPGTLEVTGYALISGVGYSTSVTTEIAGGTVDFSGGTNPQGKITFANVANGTLIDGSTPSQLISGFVGGDAVDLTNTAFESGETVSWAQTGTSGTLTVVSGGNTLATLHLLGHYTSADFTTVEDAGTGTVIEVAGFSRLYTSSSGIVVSRGETLTVEAGGTAISATVQSGGVLEVGFGGLDSGTTILRGGSEIVLLGGTDGGAIVSSGGTLGVRAGGTADPATIYSGGYEIVSAGGSDLGALISGGSQLDYGYVSAATVFTGAQIVESGGVAAATVLSGGNEIVSAHGSDQNTQIAGGSQLDHGVADGDTILAGAQVVQAGGTASGTTISGGSEIVSARGTDFDAQISGGGQFIYGLAISATVFSGGTQTVDAAGTASGSVVSSGGAVVVSAHGVAERLQVSAGGSESILGTDSGSFILGGVQSILSTGAAVSVTLIDGGVQDVGAKGKATAAFISSGGTQLIYSAGLATAAAVRSDGVQAVYSGGTAATTTISAGGTQIVAADGGGLASATTILSGGLETVSAGGTDRAAKISGGEQDVYGTASGATVAGTGTQIVESGGTAIRTTVDRGGLAIVESGSTVSNLTVASGGTAQAVGVDVDQLGISFLKGGTGELGSGAFADTLKIGNGLTAVILSGGTASSGVVEAGGTMILESGGVIASGSSGNLVISKGGVFEFVDVNADDVQNLQTVSGATLELGSGATYSGGISPGNTGKVLSGGLATAITVSTGALAEVLFGGLVSNIAVNSGSEMIVFSGGTGIGATLSAGGTGIVSAGGSDLDATVDSGGLLRVLTGGVATSDTVGSGGTEIVSAGGTAVDITIDGGGSASIVRNGSLDVEVSATNSGRLADSGTIEVAASATLTLDGVTIFGAGALLETSPGGTAIVSGVVSGGTLLANGSGSLIDITAGAVVSGGIAEVGDGIVEIAGASSENVSFTATGTGELELGGSGSAYTGKITGFGGVSGSNTVQSIDFLAVSSGGSISAVFVSLSKTSGTLEITSGGSSVVAEVTLVGKYVTSDFQISAGISGSVEITDPAATVTDGATLTLAATPSPATGTGTGTGSVALLGSYMASLFAGVEGQVTAQPATETQPSQGLLAHPHTT